MISTPTEAALTSSSISLSSSSPSRSFFLKSCRVAVFLFSAGSSVRAGVSNASSILSSAESMARSFMIFMVSSRRNFIATSTRSLIMDSTSRPTYPTSVNLVASTLMKGAEASFASRRAISVLPTPVGPIMRIFFGEISALRSSSSCNRRHLFRSAIATARLAPF